MLSVRNTLFPLHFLFFISLNLLKIMNEIFQMRSEKFVIFNKFNKVLETIFSLV